MDFFLSCVVLFVSETNALHFLNKKVVQFNSKEETVEVKKQ